MFISYNPNPAGKRVGDCVVRALCKLTHRDWETVYFSICMEGMVAFVNDESMAVNYPVSPGFTVAVINASDPENMKMYIKSSQPNGLPNPTKIFSLKDITPKAESADMVSRAEFDKLTIQLANMQALLEGLAPKGAKAK